MGNMWTKTQNHSAAATGAGEGITARGGTAARPWWEGRRAPGCWFRRQTHSYSMPFTIDFTHRCRSGDKLANKADAIELDVHRTRTYMS